VDAGATSAFIVSDYDGLGTRTFSAWGGRSDGTAFCCYVDDNATQNVDSVQFDGSTYPDSLYFTNVANGTNLNTDWSYGLMYGGLDDDILQGSDYNSSCTNGGVPCLEEALYGEGGDDRIFGFKGDDLLDGGDDLDTIDGGAQNDNINGGDGDDCLQGGSGNDTIYLDGQDGYLFYGCPYSEPSASGGSGDDYILGSDIDDSIEGDGGNDTIYGDLGDDLLYGNDGNDVIDGEEGADSIYGGANDDTLMGNIGDDLIYGDGGSDGINGWDDTDELYGGLGLDHVCGGSGTNDSINGNGSGAFESAADLLWTPDVSVTPSGGSTGSLYHCGDINPGHGTWAGSNCIYDLTVRPSKCPAFN